MIKFLKENKKQILIPLSVGLTLLMLRPFLNWIGSILIDILLSLSNSFSNSFYQEISKQNPNLFEPFILIIIIYFLCAFLWFLNDNMKKKLKELINKHKELSGEEKEIKKLAKNNSALDINFDNGYKLLLASKISSILLFVFVISSFVYFNRINQENLLFNRSLKIIRPSLANDSLIFELESQWVQMKNEKDYDRIQEVIKQYSKTKKEN